MSVSTMSEFRCLHAWVSECGCMIASVRMQVSECVGVCGQACVKPLQVMLAKAAYSFIFDAMKNSTVEEEEAEVSVLDSPEVHAACGLAILDALQTRGVLIQRALHGNSEPN